MKKLAPYFLVFSIIFASCSSNENEVLNPKEEKLLQSYTLKRDANGAYSIDFNTTNNTDVSSVINTDRSNQIILSEVNHKTAVKHSNDYNIENDHLKIGFLEANSGKRTNISIEDENPTFAKGVTEFLKSYSITANGDGTYQIDFKVSKNVVTDFVYNDDIETYEVHLSNGNANQRKFSRTLEMNSNDVLKLDFVNHKNISRTSSYNQSTDPNKKPQIIIVGHDGYY